MRIASGGNAMDYEQLARERAPTAETWNAFVDGALVDLWLAEYREQSPWVLDIGEIAQGDLTFLFDAGPTLRSGGTPAGDDRVVAVWGHSRPPERKRDRSRMAGFLPNPLRWSGRGVDRGHFVSHHAGGGLDLNLFPQSAALNRGRSEQGRLWRGMERYAASHPGTPLFVRPIYDGPTWRPTVIEYGLLTDDQLWIERFLN